MIKSSNLSGLLSLSYDLFFCVRVVSFDVLLHSSTVQGTLK
jgi:hypothetical protein